MWFSWHCINKDLIYNDIYKEIKLVEGTGLHCFVFTLTCDIYLKKGISELSANQVELKKISDKIHYLKREFKKWKLS